MDKRQQGITVQGPARVAVHEAEIGEAAAALAAAQEEERAQVWRGEGGARGGGGALHEAEMGRQPRWQQGGGGVGGEGGCKTFSSRNHLLTYHQRHLNHSNLPQPPPTAPSMEEQPCRWERPNHPNHSKPPQPPPTAPNCHSDGHYG